jgi:hypothetical protein
MTDYYQITWYHTPQIIYLHLKCKSFIPSLRQGKCHTCVETAYLYLCFVGFLLLYMSKKLGQLRNADVNSKNNPVLGDALFNHI